MQRAVSHNVTHKYTQRERIDLYVRARARANVTGFPGSLYRGAAHLLSRQVCATTPNDGSLTANLLIKRDTSSLSRKRSPPHPVRSPFVPSRFSSLDQETRDRGNKSSNHVDLSG